MNDTDITPYISILFANRNDGYGGDQLERFNTFCKYYAHFDALYPDTFEFIFCDWNPPKDRSPLKDCIDWSPLSRKKFVTVAPEQHQSFAAGISNRKIFDYVARNVCARHATAPWLFILNQDILASSDILHFIGQKKLQDKYFYRADRIDFNFKDIGSLTIDEYLNYLSKNVTTRHRRQRNLCDTEFSVSVDPSNWSKEGTIPLTRDNILQDSNLILCDRTSKLFKSDQFRSKFKLKLKKDPQRDSGSAAHPESFYLRYKLHTNASGDFIIAPREHFFSIRGCPETLDFYMHTDAYLVINLFMSGLSQAIFTGTSGAFHANHAKVDHYASEKWTWSDHLVLMNKICRSGRPYFLSSENWGMNNYHLKVELPEDSYGQR